eukprot:791419_1
MTDVENQELTALKQDLEQRGIQPSESTDNTLARTVQEQEIAGLQVQQAAQQPPPRPHTAQDTIVQNTLDATDRKQFNHYWLYLLVMSPLAIAAVIIAAQYDKNTSACGADGETYLVDPDIYLYVAGGVQLGMFVIYSLFGSHRFTFNIIKAPMACKHNQFVDLTSCDSDAEMRDVKDERVFHAEVTKTIDEVLIFDQTHPLQCDTREIPFTPLMRYLAKMEMDAKRRMNSLQVSQNTVQIGNTMHPSDLADIIRDKQGEMVPIHICRTIQSYIIEISDYLHLLMHMDTIFLSENIFDVENQREICMFVINDYFTKQITKAVKHVRLANNSMVTHTDAAHLDFIVTRIDKKWAIGIDKYTRYNDTKTKLMIQIDWIKNPIVFLEQLFRAKIGVLTKRALI